MSSLPRRTDCRCCGAAIEGPGKCRVCWEPVPAYPVMVEPLGCGVCHVPVSPNASFCPQCFKRPRYNQLAVVFAFLVEFLLLAGITGFYLYKNWPLKEIGKPGLIVILVATAPAAYIVGGVVERTVRGKTW